VKISIDSRTVSPGDFFIPVKGPNFNGAHFIEDALKKGARLLDVDLTDYAKKYRKKLTCAVIGITGSAGKTTCKDMLTAVLSKQFKVISTKENENNEIGVPLTILSADEDTDILIVEMGMRGKGEMAHLARIVRPTHVVVTGIGLSHIALFKNGRAIASAKSEIFLSRLKWEGLTRSAFINFSSNYPELLQKKALSCGYKVYPFEGQDKPDETVNMCYTVGRHFGLSNDDVQQGLSDFKSSKHRLKKIRHASLTLIDDTYNANPDGMVYALHYFKRFEGRKVVVLGDMLELGDYADEAHKSLVEPLLDAGVAIVFTLGEAMKMLSSTLLDISHFSSKEALHTALKQELKQGDVVLFKGSRGMKMEESVAYVREYVI
jgi:UDP-N-acetylmuramoyl-tripeptide--D-alanyl-D-alanine ligase